MIETEVIKYEVLSFDRINEANLVRLPCGDIRNAEWNENDDVLYFKFAGGVNPFTPSALIKERIQILKLKEKVVEFVAQVDESGYINAGKENAGKIFKSFEIPWGEDETSIQLSEKKKQLKTSDEWVQTDEFKSRGMVICDADGWDRQNFQFSFYEEEIDYEEFCVRYMRSSVAPRNSGYQCVSDLWRPKVEPTISFELQPGDVRNLGCEDLEDTIISLDDVWVYWQDSKEGQVVGKYADPIKVCSELRDRADRRLQHPSSTVHRATKNGLVQVWPLENDVSVEEKILEE